MTLAGRTLWSNGARAEILIPRAESTELTYEPIGEIGPSGGAVRAIAWHPEGQLLAITTRGGSFFQLWDVKAKKRIWEFHKQTANISSSLAFTRDGKHLIISSALVGPEYRNVALSLIDVETGRLARNIDRPPELDEAGWATSWALNATGTRLAASFFTVHPIPFAVYDTSDWHVTAVIDSPSSFPRNRRFVFDRISGLLATDAPALLLGNPGPDRPIGRPASFELWDVDANRLVRRRPISYGLLWTYVPDSHLLVLVAVDLPSQDSQQISHITLLDAENETINSTMDVVGQVENVGVSRDGSVFSAMSSDGHLSLWRTTEDRGKLTALQSLEVKHAVIAGPEFGPASDTMAFAINNLLCLSQI